MKGSKSDRERILYAVSYIWNLKPKKSSHRAWVDGGKNREWGLGKCGTVSQRRKKKRRTRCGWRAGPCPTPTILAAETG